MLGSQLLNKNLISLHKHSLKKQPWSPSSWHNLAAMQQPIYEDAKLLDACLSLIKKAPVLVPYDEIEQLKKHIARAGKGQEFLLQAGDCAEPFKDCTQQIVTNKLYSILQMKKILEDGLKKPITPIGRIAGQYAKPRSNEYETQGLLTLPSFRGDIIHSSEFSFEARKTSPHHMLTAYEKSAQTLSYIKKLHINSPFYTSHEALLLSYESALTRSVQNSSCFYNGSAHLLWLGERTRDLGGAHVEYLRGIKNPLGIKLSHKVTNAELVELILALNPSQEEGKILLIPRLGSELVELHLPRLIRAVKEANLNVIWMCDPMHGNVEVSINGIKTRRFENIFLELIRSVEIHRSQRSCLAGVHVETAAEDVTECLGGAQPITPHDLEINYQSTCDPRLNPQQSFELFHSLVEKMSCG